MSQFKLGLNRFQLELIPTYLDDLIPQDDYVRVIDAFVDSLDLINLGFKYAIPNSKGNHPYNPSDLLKLYLFGYRYGIRSSRKLHDLTQFNIKAIWLICGLKPDFRTISDFRKDNHSILKDVFVEFNLTCKELNLLSSSQSQDGTKVKAVNSKDNNFTASKLDDRRKHALQHVEDFLDSLDLNDELENKLQFLSESDKVKFMINNLDSLISSNDFDKDKCLDDLKKIYDKLSFLDSIEQKMINDSVSQVSLTDPDSRLMPDNGKFSVSYNNQVLVDTNSHIVSNFALSSNPADTGSMHDISLETKEIYNFDSLSNSTDKGYNDSSDMVDCLKDGIIPDVTPMNGKSETILETDFVEHKITDDMVKSTKKEHITSCLEAGVIPDIYKNQITSIDVKDVTVYDNVYENDDLDLSDNELRDFAMQNFCFVRNKELNKVYCPAGEILRAKSKKDKHIKFCNKLACKNCKNHCCNSESKEVVFSESQTISYPKGYNKNLPKRKKKRTKKIVKKVIFTFKPNQERIKVRMATSEHPHAQLKFWDNSRYLLLKTIEKATGELALYYCAYNIRRAINILGVPALIKYFRNKKRERIA